MLFIFAKAYDVLLSKNLEEYIIIENQKWEIGENNTLEPAICAKLETLLPANWGAAMWGAGDTLEKALMHFNKLHGAICFVKSNEQFWRNERCKPDSILKMWITIFDNIKTTTMPNGQTGYICAGHCNSFFAHTDPNQPDGSYICFNCRK